MTGSSAESYDLSEISCHCGAVWQSLKIPYTVTVSCEAQLSLCHCWNCRHVTGILCTSYLRSGKPALLERLTTYASSETTTRYFCSTCGCHCFLRRDAGGRHEWSVATGIISGRTGSRGEEDITGLNVIHNEVASTMDGGLSVWLQGARRFSHESVQSAGESPSDANYLSGRCHCNQVSFRITRPDAASSQPKSYFPDLMIPYKDGSARAANPENEKWWLRGDRRYLAGTCACKSCRLISGFEIQAWTFVPRTNILIGDKPLKFPVDSMLRSYASSTAVTREFCPGCGATVFWHDTLRPDLIDVSVGLLETRQGARAESWLDWWRQRVSFAEDARLGRFGRMAATAERLIQSLEVGMSEAQDAGREAAASTTASE